MIEFFTSNLWLIWVIISIVCLILELTSGDCFILCFAIGAAVSAIVAGDSSHQLLLGLRAAADIAEKACSIPSEIHILIQIEKVP